DREGLCGLEQARADLGPQSLVRGRDLGQSAAGRVRPPTEAQLHHPDQGAAAELRAVLLPCGRRATVLSALPHQLHPRGVRPSGHTGADNAAREAKSLRAQAQARLMSGEASDTVVETMPPPTPRGAAVAFIFVTILLDTLALGIIIPILPKLIES